MILQGPIKLITKIVNFQHKSDYENSSSQMLNQNLPIVAQPMANPMMPITQSIQTPYGQTFMIPSNATMLNSQSGSYAIQPANAVIVNPYTGQHNAQSSSLNSGVNQMPSQSATVNTNAGQTIAPTTIPPESEVNQISVSPPPYQMPLPPINKSQSEPSQPDCDDTITDSNALNDPPKPET